MEDKTSTTDTIIFLGTGGARFIVINQLLDTGGMWFNLGGTELLIDPGPGCLVHAIKKKLKPEKLSAIILSHRHLDHSSDTNIMVEAMTRGGFSPHGRLFAPADALGEEPVIYSYLRSYLDGVEVLSEGKSYTIGNISFVTPVRHVHGVETYGMIFTTPQYTFSYIPDSRFFEGLLHSYRGELLIINTVRMDTDHPFDHLSVADAKQIILAVKPKFAILTHFGMGVWRAKPWEVARNLAEETEVKVIAARDGMTFHFSELEKTL